VFRSDIQPRGASLYGRHSRSLQTEMSCRIGAWGFSEGWRRSLASSRHRGGSQYFAGPAESLWWRSQVSVTRVVIFPRWELSAFVVELAGDGLGLVVLTLARRGPTQRRRPVAADPGCGHLLGFSSCGSEWEKCELVPTQAGLGWGTPRGGSSHSPDEKNVRRYGAPGVAASQRTIHRALWRFECLGDNRSGDRRYGFNLSLAF